MLYDRHLFREKLMAWGQRGEMCDGIVGVMELATNRAVYNNWST